MNSPFRVLGIALVVEGMGKGARLAFRYPVTAPVRRDSDADSATEKQHDAGENNDLFFTLPPRVMAKIFRPKKPLCGQPMTVGVGGTVFCCRAVLLEDNDNDNSSNLVLFSVVVALEALNFTSAIPISGWFDGEALVYNAAGENSDGTNHKRQHQTGNVTSSSFRSIRRVHVSLGRLCRVLEREERRCRYVSIQSSLLLKLRNDLGLSDQGPTAAAAAATSSSNNPSTTPKSGGSVVSTATTTAPSDATKRRHRRLGSGSLVVSSVADQIVGGGGGGDQTATEINTNQKVALLDHQEREQEALEVMLAAQPSRDDNDQGDNGGKQPLYGNLARELAQTFHALSRKDHSYTPTSMALLSGQDGIVYINRHVAVPIESISGDSFTFSSATLSPSNPAQSPGGTTMAALMDNKPVIRPYHTLLFPHASPSEYLETLTVSSSASFSSRTAPQQLEQLLLTANPRKPLSDISADAGLPLACTLELAGYLVSHGICVISPVLGRSSRLACCHDAVPKKMQSLSLNFCQRFGPHLPISLMVSVLTSHGASLGELMSRVSSSIDEQEDDSITLVGDRIAASLGQQQQQVKTLSSSGLVKMDGGRDLVGGGVVGSPRLHGNDPGVVRTQDVEEVVYSMAVWLRAHLVIVDLKDYLVAIGGRVKPSGDTAKANGVDAGGAGAAGADADNAVISESVKSNSSLMERERNHKWGNTPEEALYNELLEAGCLNGNISTLALCWRFGIDGRRLHRLRTWGFRHKVLHVVTRIPTPGDDWGAV